MEQFASENRNINVIGLGAQDNLNLAKDFYNRGGFSSVNLVWDSSGTSWRKLGVFGQPAWVLFDGQGNRIIGPRSGRIDETKVLSELSG